MKVSFYPRDNKIYVRVFHRNQMIRVSTGITMPSYTKFKGDVLMGDTSEVASLNAELMRKRANITELYGVYKDLYEVKRLLGSPEPNEKFEESSDDMSLVSLMYKYINMMATGEVKSRRKDSPYRESTIRSYKYAADLLATYKKPLTITEYILEGKTIRERKEIGESFNRYFDRFKDYMVSMGLQVNTRVDIINIITTMINYWADVLYIQIPRPAKLSGYEPPIIALDDDFLRRFVMDEHNLYKKFDDKYKYIWEVTALMMVTSLRISDAVSLTRGDFQISGDYIFLMKDNAKTGEMTEMPLPKSLSAKFFDNLAAHGHVFTPVSYWSKQALIRREYKEFFRQYPEMHNQVTVKKMDIAGQKVSMTKCMFEWVHPHMMRKSAITAMLANDVSEDHVKFCSGHKPGSKSFERYKGFVEKRYKSEVNDYQNKMFK